MYTVKELIEALQQCPEDYEVLVDGQVEVYRIAQIGLDHDEKVVDLFAE